MTAGTYCGFTKEQPCLYHCGAGPDRRKLHRRTSAKVHHRPCAGGGLCDTVCGGVVRDMGKQAKNSEGGIMKRTTDDFSNWRLQQENMSKPFPYVFPQIPPRFRLYRSLMQTLFLMEWGCIWLFAVGGVAAFALMLFWGKEAMLEDSIFSLLITALFFILLPQSFLCRWLRNTPKIFWHCPCCGQPFPYYSPPLLRGLDVLKEADCLYLIEHLRIQYAKTRFCPLIIPSVCPECKCKFFEMTGNEQPSM